MSGQNDVQMPASESLSVPIRRLPSPLVCGEALCFVDVDAPTTSTTRREQGQAVELLDESAGSKLACLASRSRSVRTAGTGADAETSTGTGTGTSTSTGLGAGTGTSTSTSSRTTSAGGSVSSPKLLVQSPAKVQNSASVSPMSAPLKSEDIGESLRQSYESRLERRTLRLKWTSEEHRRRGEERVRDPAFVSKLEALRQRIREKKEEKRLAAALVDLLQCCAQLLSSSSTANAFKNHDSRHVNTGVDVPRHNSDLRSRRHAAKSGESRVSAFEQGNQQLRSDGECNCVDIAIRVPKQHMLWLALQDEQSAVGDGSDASSVRRDAQHPFLDYASVIEMNREDHSDLSGSIVRQIARYARQLLIAHPFARRVHVVTWTGSLVRLWQYNANGIVLSRPFALMETSDSSRKEGSADSVAELGKLCYLLMSGEATVLPRWTPCSPDAKAQLRDMEVGIEIKDHQSVRIINVRPSIDGSRTVLFGTPITNVHFPQQFKTQYPWVFFKCSWLPERLSQHEHTMLKELSKTGCAPDPIGNFQLPWTTSTLKSFSRSEEDEGQHRMLACVLVFAQHRGTHIPYTLSVAEKADVFAQLSQQLCAYAKRGYHYRDLNTGNVLIRYENDKLVLNLVDHGNVRHGFVRGLETTAEDDARSANQLFIPSGMHRAVSARDSFIFAGQRLLVAVTDRDKMLRRRQWYDEHRELYLSLHRYCDDLESSIYILIWLSAKPGMHDQLRRILTDAGEKTNAWSKEVRFEMLLIEHLGAEEVCNDLLLELYRAIRHAQEASLKRVETHYEEMILNGESNVPFEIIESRLKTVGELPLTPEEEQCMAVEAPRLFRKMSRLQTASDSTPPDAKRTKPKP
ncbi:hypothetical protein IE81DRAFT_222565 [Ceraceosorus guamensis]|uniref:Fungal-type protein kinase domain-containing protein n=1 Tax=Ceraceosorus guamensis TaxID=1522189 RepID=A0A316VS88_9BASI|nr:hypothetical protein IE81DRAFT_222565 [Ceraceosorus guamensis]PWN40372.1 hypothetical protein IE81DRAFT_222565 [Ceraceosorus guamensis]